MRPQLAEAAPSVENGLWKVFPDGRRETSWRLKPGALWVDGTPVTAADLLSTAMVSQDRELPLFRHGAFDSVESVEPPDERSPLIRWRKPYIGADEMFSAVRAHEPLAPRCSWHPCLRAPEAFQTECLEDLRARC